MSVVRVSSVTRAAIGRGTSSKVYARSGNRKLDTRSACEMASSWVGGIQPPVLALASDAWFQPRHHVMRDAPDGAPRAIRAISCLVSRACRRTGHRGLARWLDDLRMVQDRLRHAELTNNAMGIGSRILETANTCHVTIPMKCSGTCLGSHSGQAVPSPVHRRN